MEIIKYNSNKYDESSDETDEESPRKLLELDKRKCKYCGSLCTSKNAVLKHLSHCESAKKCTENLVKTTDGSCRFICEICFRTFKLLSGLTKHKARHDPPGGFMCKYCNKRYCTDLELQKHKEEAHRLHKCVICKDIFNDEESYSDHISKVHNGRNRVYEICEDCGSQFRTMTNLLYHKQALCDTIKPFKCKKCNANFRTKWTLKQHMRIHNEEKQFLCKYCGESFLKKNQLINHQRKHTKEKPFVCEICSKAFGYRESLVTHMSIHTGIKPYLCEACGLCFSCFGNLNKHRRNRPNSCGLPQYKKNAKIAPRPSFKSGIFTGPKKIIKGNKVFQTKSESKNNNFNKTLKVSKTDITIAKTAKNEHTNSNINSKNKYLNTELLIENLDLNLSQIEIVIDEKDVNKIQSELETVNSFFDNSNDKDENNYNQNAKEHEGNKRLETNEKEVFIEEDCFTLYDIHFNDSYSNDNNDEILSRTLNITKNYNALQNECNIKNNSNTSLISETTTINEVIKTENKIDENNSDDDDVPLSQLIEKKSQTNDLKTTKILLNQNMEKSYVKLESDKNVINQKDNDSFKNKNESFSRNSLIDYSDSDILKSSIKQLFECDLCPKYFVFRGPYIKHLVVCHGRSFYDAECSVYNTIKTKNKKNILRCQYCGKIYYLQKRLKEHETLHGPDGKLLFKCSCCPNYFGSVQDVNEHAKINHSNILTCEICKKIFSTIESISAHRRRSHKPNKLDKNTNLKITNICQKCGLKFVNKSTLNDHERSNCGQNPLYECTVCKKRYCSTGSLNTHMRSHSDTLPFKCSYCSKMFLTKSQCEIHKRKHTGDKPFKCDICDKSFPYRESLITHSTLHTGIKRYLCSGCGTRFSCISNLQNHRRTHKDTCGKLPLNSKPISQAGIGLGVLKYSKNSENSSNN